MGLLWHTLYRREAFCFGGIVRFSCRSWTQKWGQPSENFAAARTCCASRFATLQLEHECQLIPFSLCASQVRLLLSRSLYRSHVLTTFLGPVLGAMMKQVVGIQDAPRLTEACPRHEDKARLTGTRIYIMLLLSLSNDWWSWQWDTVVPSGLARVLLFVKAAPVLAKKVTAESHFRSCRTLALDSKKWSSPVALKNWWSNNPQLWSTCVVRRPFCLKVWWEDVQCTEPPWTYLNIFKPLLEQCMCRWTVRKPFEVCRNRSVN